MCKGKDVWREKKGGGSKDGRQWHPQAQKGNDG